MKAARANASFSRGHKPGVNVRMKARMRKGYAIASIYPGKGHAELRPIELGTKPGYRIAKDRGPFKFYAGNRLIETRIIKHPGTAPRPWLRPAMDSSRLAAVEAMGDALRLTIEKAKILAEESDE